MTCYRNKARIMVLAGIAWVEIMGPRPLLSQVTWSPRLNLASRADIPAALQTPQPSVPNGVVYTNGTVTRTVKSCQDFFDSQSAGFYPQNNLQVRLSTSFVFQCYVLRDLQVARPAIAGSAYHWSQNSLTQLPPMLVVGSKDVQNAAENAEQSGVSWKQYHPDIKITSIKNDQLDAEDDDNYYGITIVARGDFNGDGIEDFVAVGTSKGKQSTWEDSQYFVFSQGANGKLIRLTSDKIPFLINVQIPH